MKYLITALLSVLFCVQLQAQDNEKYARPDIPGELMIDVGLNFMSSSPGGIEKDVWPSKSVGIYYSRRKGLNEKFSFYYGLGLGLDKIGLGDSSTLISNDSVSVIAIPDGYTYTKNRLATTYLEVPLEIRFHPSGTEAGEGFFIGAGAIIGVKLKAHTKWKYDEEGETVKQKISGNYNLSTFRFGVQGRVGFKGVHFFYKKYFTSLYKDLVLGIDPTMTTIGINFTGF